MAIGNLNFEMPDPGYYDDLISDQKKIVDNDFENAAKWVELGRLQESKAQMTSRFAKKSLLIRWLPIGTYLFFIFAVYQHIKYLGTLPLAVLLPVLIFALIIIIFMTLTRYPRSGKQYFQKALVLDPSNAEAYMYLGLIALRQHQKKKAYSLFEHACEKGSDKKLERELKTIYQKEFFRFFNKKSAKEKVLYRTIEPLENEIASLKIEIDNLKNKNTTVVKKVKAARAQTDQTIRQTKIDMKIKMEEIHNDYENQIADLEQAMEVEEAQKESAHKKINDLNLQIMEAKAFGEQHSFGQIEKKLQAEIGTVLWRALSKQARSCLATAEHAFSMLDKTSDGTDFSLIGMELCKALETEINQKLIQPFVKTLDEQKESFLHINKIGESKGLPVYFTMLARVADTQHYPETISLTLGQYLFVLKKTLEGEYALDEYGNYLDNILNSSGVVIDRKFLQKLKTVTQDYRNSIVHYSQMNLQQCLNLRELIFLKDDSLLLTCCQIIKNSGNNIKTNNFSVYDW